MADVLRHCVSIEELRLRTAHTGTLFSLKAEPFTLPRLTSLGANYHVITMLSHLASTPNLEVLTIYSCWASVDDALVLRPLSKKLHTVNHKDDGRAKHSELYRAHRTITTLSTSRKSFEGVLASLNAERNLPAFDKLSNRMLPALELLNLHIFSWDVDAVLQPLSRVLGDRQNLRVIFDVQGQFVCTTDTLDKIMERCGEKFVLLGNVVLYDEATTLR